MEVIKVNLSLTLYIMKAITVNLSLTQYIMEVIKANLSLTLCMMEAIKVNLSLTLYMMEYGSFRRLTSVRLLVHSLIDWLIEVFLYLIIHSFNNWFIPYLLIHKSVYSFFHYNMYPYVLLWERVLIGQSWVRTSSKASVVPFSKPFHIMS